MGNIMSKNITPKVYIIGCSQPDKEGIGEWLSELGVSHVSQFKYVTAFNSPGDTLVELAGRRCYNSFEVGLNPNVTKIRENIADYIDNILAVRHGSVLRHVTYTFAIENVSRVFTAELNRHSIGTAISEGSLRYIRYTDISWWIPHSIIPQEGDSAKLLTQKERTLIVFKRAFSQMEDNYRELEEIWELGTDTTLTFAFKKALTSLFRRIIGMGVATGGVWTGNIEALRWICEIRSEPHVEEEILYVVGLMLQQLKEKEPHLFGDFYLNEGFWRVKYSKV